MPQLSRAEILDRATSGESLRGINLVRADLSAVSLARADLTEANLRMADLSRADLTDARLTGCYLSGATLNQAQMMGANLVEASMIGVMLKGTNLSRADLSGADLTGAILDGACLEGAYLVGTYLNESDLSGANLSGAFIRMAQIAGSNLTAAMIEGADLSHADMSGVCLANSCLARANLTGANLSSSVLTSCDLRGADLTGANLSGCNLTGARLRDIKFNNVKLDGAWAEWVNLSNDDAEDRTSLEEVFASAMGKPIAQVLVEGHIGHDVWTVILAHLNEFHITHPHHSDVRLKAIFQGAHSSALYLEANQEVRLAAYLAEFADIMGKGSLELFEKLAAVISDRNGHNHDASLCDLSQADSPDAVAQASASRIAHSGVMLVSDVEALQQTDFWASEKAIVILTNSRHIWLEAASSASLTIHPPRDFPIGIDFIRGRFVTHNGHRSKDAR